MTPQPLIIAIVIACLVVALILIRGISMFGTGADPKKSNKVMQMRILAQLVAVVIIVVGALMLNGAE
ncbi:twin transmembrane helix small protein [Salibaculum sp.]|uniref:twin transmembrane helix small protein n=1 Tax=Salibaculum sp. TaxID=2855480 RepID=UPI002B48C573|nr:twin transmembrane helix small protein [Salibaculum sp.]HKL70370.1 twin transmembrane helix small protein [Salibaculum sp.]